MMRSVLIVICGLVASPSLAAPQSYASGQAGNIQSVSIGTFSTATVINGGIVGDRRGPVQANGRANRATALALGAGSRATVMVGSVIGDGGGASASGSVRSATALAAGLGGRACVAVGTVGQGGSRARGAAGNVVAYDLGFFRRTRVRVGTSGHTC